MSVSSAVHYRGRALAITAFENRDVKAWAVFNNKQFMASFNGASAAEASAALDEYLSLMDRAENVAVYTVKVYEDLKPGEKIKSNTADDGSFNFRFNEPAGGSVGSAANAGNWEMLQLLKKMDARIDQLEKDQVDEDPEQQAPNIVGQIKGFLEIPGMQALISGLVTRLTGVNAPAPSLGFAPAPAAAAAPGPAQYPGSADDPEVQEYATLIETYKQIKFSGMPDILQILQKLAHIAVTDQEKLRGIQTSIKMFL